jgi:hypothetical protein
MTHLNDISKIYLEQIAESAVPGKPAERLGAVTAIPKSEQEAARQRILAKTAAKRKAMQKEENDLDEAVKGTDSEMRRVSSAERRSGDKRLPPSAGKAYANQQKQSISYMDKLTKKNKNVVGLVTKEELDSDLDEVYLQTPAKSSRTETSVKKKKDPYGESPEDYRKRMQTKLKKYGYAESLDPVGKEDDDIDNDGEKNDENDKYIRNKRKAIGKAISKKKGKCDECGEDPCECDDKEYSGKNEEFSLVEIHSSAHTPHEVPDKDLKGLVKRAVKRIDTDVDGDTDNNDKAKGELGEFIPGVANKRLFSTARVKTAKESFSNWRQDLIEVADDAGEKQIKEMSKGKTNKITINPKISEAIESLGGTIIEEVELDEVDYIIETVYDELLEEGYNEDWIEESIEYALFEATVTYGHDTEKPYQKKSGARHFVKAVGRLARKKASELKAKAATAAKKALVAGARKVAAKATSVANKYDPPSSAQSKSGVRASRTYSGAGVGRREKVSSGEYTPPKKKVEAPKPQPKKMEKIEDPWKGSETTPKKPQAKKSVTSKAKKPKPPKATSKTTKAATKSKSETSKSKKRDELDDLLSSIRNEETIQEKAVSQKQQRFMGMVYAAKKGGKPASPEVAKAAASMSKAEAKKFAKTKHKGLPSKVEESMQGEVELTPQEVQLQRKSAAIDKRLAAMRERKVSQQKPVNAVEK